MQLEQLYRNNSLRRIKLISKTRLKLDSSQSALPVIYSAPRSAILHWIKTLKLASIPDCLNSNCDLTKGIYEGGFKVWEATSDLVKHLNEEQVIIDELLASNRRLKVLELGAGAGLASLGLISRLINDSRVETNYRIHLQDYNWQVLATLTLLNFALNLPPDYLRELIEKKCLRFFAGDWRNFRIDKRYRYNLIIMSEVLYDSDNYESLHDLLDARLKDSGYIIIATKDTYFGLSGGLYSWLDYLSTRNIFTPRKVIRASSGNIPRSIVILERLLIIDNTN